MAIFPIISSNQANLTPERVRAIAAWSHEAGESLYDDVNGSHYGEGDIFAGRVATGNSTAAAAATRAGLEGVPLDIHFDLDELDPFVGHETDREYVADRKVGVKHTATAAATPAAAAAAASFHRRRDASLRESKRREALLKGKEGSRRRQRWENSQLLNNPWAQPPEPSDWDIQPTAPRREIPYHLAPLWENHYAQIASKKAQKAASKKSNNGGENEFPIPRELRLKLKHARAARGLLKDIEGSIRTFIEEYHGIGEAREGSSSRCLVERSRSRTRTRTRSRSASSSSSSMSCSAESDNASCPKLSEAASAESGSTLGSVDSDDFVIVGDGGQTVGKGTATTTMTMTTTSTSTGRSHEGSGSSMIMDHRMIFDGSVEDQTASFARWIVHSLATYYGLSTWSVTSGDRREAYVGYVRPSATAASASATSSLPHAKARTKKGKKSKDEKSCCTVGSVPILPRPLWMSI